MMDNLFNGLIGIVLIIGTIAGIARHDFWKRKNEYMGTIEKKNKYTRTIGRVNLTIAVSIIVMFGLFYFKPNDTQEPVVADSSEEVNVENPESKQVKLGPYSVAAIPNGVPSAYTTQYNELADIISRADATLRLIKNTINKCEAPCPKPLSEIEQQFLLLSDVIDNTRNELFRGSEIARVMAEENPQGLDTLKLYELQQDLISTEYSLETMQLADSWESWDEPVEYADSTKTKRLYNTPLANTLAKPDYYVEGSTKENGEPIINEETPEALQSAENVILGFMELTEEIRTIVDSVYVSMDADHVAADYALVIIESTREQAVIATNSFNHPKGVEELEVAITKLDSLKAKLLEYNKMQEAPGWDFDRYDEVLMHVDTFYEDLDFNPVTVKQLLEVYGY